jgi:hypothetical protein
VVRARVLGWGSHRIARGAICFQAEPMTFPKPEPRKRKGLATTLGPVGLSAHYEQTGMTLAFPKSEPRRQTKARKDRHEAAVIKKVRAAVVERDGECRLWRDFISRWQNETVTTYIGFCFGPSQWTHLPPKTRAATRKMAPEQRHGTAWTIMACERHHDLLDGRQQPRIVVRCLTPDGADGPIAVEVA